MRAAVLTLLLISNGSALARTEEEEVICFTRDTNKSFVVRDQNPLLAGVGLPVTLPAIIPYGPSARVDLYWGSTALMQARGDEALLVDAETREARLTLFGSFNDARIGWQLQLPYRYTGGGNLDSFIDSWHDTFGLPDGARSALPRDQIGIAYSRDGTRPLTIDSSNSGVGDIQAAIGYQVPNHVAALTAWLTVELPTGDADTLTGSGGTDVSLVLAGQKRLGRWALFGQGAATYFGEGDLLPDQQRSVVWSGMLGISREFLHRLSLKAQIDAHTAAYDSDLDFFSEAVILTVGGRYQFDSWRVELGVSEDLAVEHSPDVVFLFSINRGYW